MGLENLTGRECMLIAVWSATGINPSTETYQLRSKQLLEDDNESVDPFVTAQNLEELFNSLGIKVSVRVKLVNNTNELILLISSYNITFIGLKGGTDTLRNDHFVHIHERVSDGFISNQQFTSDTVIRDQFFQQIQIPAFVIS